jgi:hypothetical protein
MSIFKAIFCWVYVLGSLTMLVSASPIDTSSTALIANTTVPLFSTYDPNFVNLEPRQKKKKTWYGGCKRENVGQHNCKLMRQTCHMFYQQFPDNDSRRKGYKWNCKTTLCMQTKGDCHHLACGAWC